MRARQWLIASSLLVASCSTDAPIEDEYLDSSVVAGGNDSGSQSGSDSGSSTDSGGQSSSDSGSGSSDAGPAKMDASLDAGSAATDAGSTDGGGLDATSGDAASDATTVDATDNSAIAMLGAPCVTALDKACTGHNAADKLVCIDGKWAHNGSCDTDARCETQKGPSQGLCVTIATGCAGKMPGAIVCEGMAVKTCGPDLTDLKTSRTCGDNAHCEDTSTTCKCDTGYASATAGGACTDADDCAAKPCGDGNTCMDALGDFTCSCGNNSWMKDAKTCVSRFDRVSAGGNRTCAIRKDRTVACWGEGTDGNSSSPVQIAGLTNVTQISVGVDHACALREGGTMSCWGRNNHGQLGNGNRTDSLNTPVTVPAFNFVQQISAGAGFTCAIALTGPFNNVPRAFCWGDNGSGQLGIGNTNADATTPQQVGGNSNINYNLVAAGSGHACARRASNGNDIYCWGKNDHGQVGNNATSSDRIAPTAVGNAGAVSNPNELVAGNGFSCARKNGNVYCWGAPLGDSSLANALTPTAVTGLSDAVQISAGAGGSHVCARKSGSGANQNTVACWGSDADGQLGTEGAPTSSTAPVAVSGSLNNVKEVAAGSKHSCAVKSIDGEIWCWGDGAAGELGNGAKNDFAVPVVAVH